MNTGKYDIKLTNMSFVDITSEKQLPLKIYMEWFPGVLIQIQLVLTTIHLWWGDFWRQKGHFQNVWHLIKSFKNPWVFSDSLKNNFMNFMVDI